MIEGTPVDSLVWFSTYLDEIKVNRFKTILFGELFFSGLKEMSCMSPFLYHA